MVHKFLFSGALQIRRSFQFSRSQSLRRWKSSLTQEHSWFLLSDCPTQLLFGRSNWPISRIEFIKQRFKMQWSIFLYKITTISYKICMKTLIHTIILLHIMGCLISISTSAFQLHRMHCLLSRMQLTGLILTSFGRPTRRYAYNGNSTGFQFHSIMQVWVITEFTNIQSRISDTSL
jgi:hypothetical protein